MIETSILSRLSNIYAIEPEDWAPVSETSIGIEAVAWVFPYEEEVRLVDLESRHEMMNDLLQKARGVIGEAPYQAYKGGDLMWVHSTLSIADRIVLLDSNDKFDILRFEGTQGNNYPISNEKLIDALQVVDEDFGINIVGATYGVVEFLLLKELSNQNETDLANLIMQICPDVRDDFRGFGSKRVVLYWD